MESAAPASKCLELSSRIEARKKVFLAKPISSSGLFAIILVLLGGCVCSSAEEETKLGGEKVYFTTPEMTPDVSHRQNVCDRWNKFRSSPNNELRHGLSGMELNVVVGAYEGAYFNYDAETGIDSEYPGLIAVILDDLAQRANFTWRNSFGIYGDLPNFGGATWDDLLMWSIDTYDLAVDWWPQNLERMNKGVVFIKEWHDSSLMLVSKKQEEDSSNNKDTINLWNWLKPYDVQVWGATIFTIIISAIVYQILEWFADDRQDRTMWEWCQENIYLSAINFTQAYEYQPKTFASRLFGISMAIWALVMTATYTANLASLLVDRRPPPPGPQSIAEVAVLGYRICVWEATQSQYYLQENFEDAHVIAKPTLPEVYQGLQDDECDYLVDAAVSWNKLKAIADYNPQCEMYWVGTDRIIKNLDAGFTCKADAGNYCTGFIRDVLNIHMHEMIEDGTLQKAWDEELERTQTIDCDTYQPGKQDADDLSVDNSPNTDETGRRRLQQLRQTGRRVPHHDITHNMQRLLKAGGKGATGGAVAIAAASASDDERRLTLEQMIGTFAFHWGLMVIALILATGNALYVKYVVKRDGKSFAVAPQTSLEVSSHGNSPGIHEATASIGDEENSNDKEQIQDLRKQLAAMQLHLQQFEEKMLEKQQAALVSQQSFQEQIQLFLETSTGRDILLSSRYTRPDNGKSLVSGDIPPFDWEIGK